MLRKPKKKKKRNPVRSKHCRKFNTAAAMWSYYFSLKLVTKMPGFY